jgi:hypothetical protein
MDGKAELDNLFDEETIDSNGSTICVNQRNLRIQALFLV